MTEVIKERTKIEWGRVDFWDGNEKEGWDSAGSERIICKVEGTPLPKAVYAFCSEKEKKTIVICINQMTDNPALAQQIFESFRWIE